jgi:glucan 1,3-beta-glucosidase
LSLATKNGVRAAVALALAALLMLWSWWRDAQPVTVADGPAARLQCLSYAPSGGRYQPLQPVTREEIRRDLALLAARTSCVRTYTVSDGFDQVPSVAHELGLQVILGAWIGREAEHNEEEVARVIDVANRHRDTIRAIVVGNEVMLRHELPPAQLASLIRRVGEATGLPVTYADVWGFWVKHRVLSEAVSFVTVHIIPYWDDDPVGIDAVIPYVDDLYAQMQRQFPGKEVLIGETGWPSVGRPRGAIEPGRVNQARYVREFAALAEERGIRYNLIEAFDQPWKRVPEGTVGGHWGLYDRDGREKFPWTGPIAEVPWGRSVILWTLVAAALGALAGGFTGSAQRPLRSLVLGTSAAILVTIGARQANDLMLGNATVLDWGGTLVVAAAGWLGFALAVRTLLRPDVTRDPLPTALTLFLLLACAYVCLGLVFAGRHRDFHVWLFLPAALGLAITALANPAARALAVLRTHGTEQLLLAAWLAVAGLLIPLQEGFANGRSIGWGALSLLMGSAVLLPLALQARQHQRTAQHADARPREAVEHHADRADGHGEDGDRP